VDLARRVAPGRVVAIDNSPEALAQARTHAKTRSASVEFHVSDAYSLPFADASFDVVHAHQLLQHVPDPVRALAEMRRVLRPGGLVGARDCDYGSFAWSPSDPRLTRWLAVYCAVARHNGGEPDAGRFLKGWAIAAGFREVHATSSTWTYADRESCEWWANSWADRCEISSLAGQSVEYGLSTREELDAMAAPAIFGITGRRPFPSSSPNRAVSSGSTAFRKRSASSKNAFSLAFRDSSPSSSSSTSMRLALSLRRLAIARTRLATLAGRVTLWRTVFSFVGMTPVCITVVQTKSFEWTGQNWRLG
jgi:ubiquinone/menaquinone biosynthesis C-methylase UbiE